MSMIRYPNPLVALAFAGALGGAIVAAPVEAGTTKVTIGWPTSTSLTSAPLFYARELGFFKEEGLEFELLNFRGSGTVVPQVVAKRIMVGFPNPDPLLISQQPDKEAVPVKFFYNMTPKSIWEIVTLADSEVRELADLKGQKLGIGALQWGNVPVSRAMLQDSGLGPDDYEFVPVGAGSAAFVALKNGSVAALNLFDVVNARLAATGTKIRHLNLPEKFTSLFSNGFIAHEDTLAEDRETLVAFGRAIAKGTVACEANREGCVKAFWKANPEQAPQNPDDPAELATAVKILNARLSKYTSLANPMEYGSYDPQVWTDFVEVLHEGGQLSTTDIKPTNVYTNDLVPAINDFDRDAVIAKAVKG